MLDGLKSFVVSWTTKLYGLKFAKLPTLAVIFLISYNWSVLLQEVRASLLGQDTSQPEQVFPLG
jgi:hypothetical protein